MRIGVIGAGAAGLTAAWLLESNHDVTLFERSDRLGGHVDTIDVELDGKRVPVEAGFEFFNASMFPTFMALLTTLGVAVRRYPMSITIHHAEDGLVALLPPIQGLTVKWSAFRPRRVVDMLEVARLQRAAARLVARRDTSVTTGDFLRGVRMTARFRERFVYPLMLACWDVERSELERFAAWDVLQYLLAPRDGRWLEVVGGARVYVETLARRLTRTDIRRSASIAGVSRVRKGFAVRDETGSEVTVDHLVVATGPHEARTLLAGVADAESLRRDLAAIEHFRTTIAVHGDRRLMPRRESHWSVVNTRYDGVHGANTVWNRWRSRTPVFRSWITHYDRPIEPLYAVRTYDHVMPTPAYFRAQDALAARQGEHRLWLAGLYTRGLDTHESAIASAVALARRLDPLSANLKLLEG